MKVLILGGTGMLGHKVVQRLARAGRPVWWTLRGTTQDPALDPVPELRGSGALEGVDASQFKQIAGIASDLRPDVVVNCIGVIKQRAEALDPVPCITINALLPHRLSRMLAPLGARLIHISTDCVFAGDRGRYSETDVPDAADLYGMTKALGEVRADNVLTLRTSIIGRELRYHQSLLDWFLSQQGRTISGFRQVQWSGVTSLYFAELLDRLIHCHPDLSGLYNVAAAPVSKYRLLEMLREAYGLEVHIAPDDTVRRDLTLDGSRFAAATASEVPAWPALINALVSDSTAYPALGLALATASRSAAR